MSASTRANQGNKMPWDYYLKKRLNNNRDDYFYAKCAAKANEINTMYEWLKRKRTEKGLLYVKYMVTNHMTYTTTKVTTIVVYLHITGRRPKQNAFT